MTPLSAFTGGRIPGLGYGASWLFPLPVFAGIWCQHCFLAPSSLTARLLWRRSGREPGRLLPARGRRQGRIPSGSPLTVAMELERLDGQRQSLPRRFLTIGRPGRRCRSGPMPRLMRGPTRISAHGGHGRLLRGSGALPAWVTYGRTLIETMYRLLTVGRADLGPAQ